MCRMAPVTAIGLEKGNTQKDEGKRIDGRIGQHPFQFVLADGIKIGHDNGGCGDKGERKPQTEKLHQLYAIEVADNPDDPEYARLDDSKAEFF